MATSDSEGFESADEGHSNVDKKERKQRLSSNYSDKTVESDPEPKKPSGAAILKDSSVEKVVKVKDGWDDFKDEDSDCVEKTKQKTDVKLIAQKDGSKVEEDGKFSKTISKDVAKTAEESKDTGWDDFDDWGDNDGSNTTTQTTTTVQKVQTEKVQQPEDQRDKDIRELTERLAATSTNTQSSGWGWGWGVDSLLSSATAGITSITNQVSQGISTVLETSIGAPDPEELARRTKESATAKPSDQDRVRPDDEPQQGMQEPKASGDAAFPFGNLLSGVTKFVETTGTKVIAGGLDTLETIGKKTMEVLQDGDPGLAKKRAMLGLDAADKPVLSQVLREAKAKAEEEDRLREEKREAKEVHYENLFDDFEGLVHLEALEMLSRQVSMRIEERLRTADSAKRQDIKETLQQVSELCEMPEEEEEDDEDSSGLSKPEAFHERLQTATQDLGLKLQFQPLVKQYTDILEYLSTDLQATEKAVYKRAVSGLAQATALSVEIYHKAGEMLLVKSRRSTADEADALTQMTVVLSRHISELATLFTEKLNSIAAENKDQVNTYITNIFLEILLENAKSEEDKEKIKSAYEILVDPQKMGERFKFMAFYPSSMGPILERYPPLGFSTAKKDDKNWKSN